MPYSDGGPISFFTSSRRFESCPRRSTKRCHYHNVSPAISHLPLSGRLPDRRHVPGAAEREPYEPRTTEKSEHLSTGPEPLQVRRPGATR
jgi:hypothetical protein